MPAPALDEHLGLSLRFHCVLDGIDMGMWSKVDGLNIQFELIQYMESEAGNYVHQVPGRTKWNNIKLTRAVTEKDTKAVMDWIKKHAKAPSKGTGKITCLTAWGIPAGEWELTGVLPVSWTGPSFDSSSHNVAMEVLEIAHEGWIDYPK